MAFVTDWTVGTEVGGWSLSLRFSGEPQQFRVFMVSLPIVNRIVEERQTINREERCTFPFERFMAIILDLLR
jgi:hypothetical protein